MSLQQDPQELVDHLFRREAGRMVSVLTRLFGFSRVQTAQDIVQETLLAALSAWRLQLPEHPRAWLYRTAKNKALDHLRRHKTWEDRVAPKIQQDVEQAYDASIRLENLFREPDIEDSQLRMLFACCHPQLAPEAQLALMLKTLCGLSVGEIAAAFLTGKDTIEKRLYRTREKIRQERIELEVPSGIDLQPRLDTVLKAIYLLFSEGYHSASRDELIRRDLCSEAVYLSDLLTKNPVTSLPKTHALHSLICFQASRFDARIDAAGQMVLMENQDRQLWDATLIARGFAHLNKSASGGEFSMYHLEAAIASYHAQADTFENTNWQAIFYLYQLLLQHFPSPVVAFNRAIAMGYAQGAPSGLKALLEIKLLEESHFYHAAVGDFYQKSGNFEAAEAAYKLSLKLALLPLGKQLLAKKISDLKKKMAD